MQLAFPLSADLRIRVVSAEKENKNFLVEIEELKNEIESLARGKSQAVSVSKELEGKLIEMNSKVDDAIRQLTDANSAKSHLMEENLNISRRLETVEYELSSVQTAYKRAHGDLDEARLHLESEMAVSRRTMSSCREKERSRGRFFRPTARCNRR